MWTLHSIFHMCSVSHQNPFRPRLANHVASVVKYPSLSGVSLVKVLEHRHGWVEFCACRQLLAMAMARTRVDVQVHREGQNKSRVGYRDELVRRAMRGEQLWMVSPFGCSMDATGFQPAEQLE